MSDNGKIRRNIEPNVDAMEVRIAEHYGTVTEGNYEEITANVYRIDSLPSGIKTMLMCHGLAQKLSDCTAGMSDAKGFSTSDRFDKIDELYKQLVTGDWAKRREGAGTKLSQTQIASKMEALGLSPEQFELAKKMGLIKG